MAEAPLSRVVLTVDLVDFEPLLKAHGAALLQLLNGFYYQTCQSVAAANGGAVLRRAGGTVTCHFPSGVQALKAAARIHTEMALRNQGRKSGEPEVRARTGAAIGSTSGGTLAEPARIDASSPPGGIVVTGDLFQQVNGRVPVKFAPAGDLFQGFPLPGAPSTTPAAAARPRPPASLPVILVVEPVRSPLRLYYVAAAAVLGLLAISWVGVFFSDHDFSREVRRLTSADQIRIDAATAAARIQEQAEARGMRVREGSLRVKFRDYLNGCHTQVELDYRRRSTFLLPVTVHYQWEDTHVEGGRGVSINCHSSEFPAPEPAPQPSSTAPPAP